LKNDAVCFPSLSFKDRVVGTALAAARRFGFETVGCSSTGNLANAVAAQAAQHGFDACVFIPADLEPAKVLNTAVYGARIVRINGNYDHVNRLCAQIADRYRWGLVNVNLRPYYSEGSKTHGYEIAEQLGWKLPDNVVVPMTGGSLITTVAKAFKELVTLGWVEDKRMKFFEELQRAGHARLGRGQAGEVLWRAGDRLLANLRWRKAWPGALRAAETQHHCAFAGDRQSRRRPVCHEARPRIRRLGGRRLRSGNRGLDQAAGRNRRHFHRDGRRSHRRGHEKTDRAEPHQAR